MRIYAVTQKGTQKIENEDRIIVGKSIISDGEYTACIGQGILAIADGVGGNRAGATASHLVAVRLSDVSHISYDTVKLINDDLIFLSNETDTTVGMATTLSGIQIESNEVKLFSIGNTRVYALQSGKYLKQLTKDDTTLNYLISTGQLTAEEAEHSDRRNEITACMGGGKPDWFRFEVKRLEPLSQPVLLTSDGVHDYVSIDRMEEIIAEKGISLDACKALVKAAEDNGSKDDISIMLGAV